MKPMAKITNHVHTTKDYFPFKTINGNRNINSLHLKRLKESISKNYLFTVIVVNEDYEIIDGQHRFEVIKELELPLNYIKCTGYGLNEVHILNENSKDWTANDFLSGYCDLGLADYKIYRSFKKKYKFGHNESMAMLRGTQTGHGDIYQMFKSGDFKITHLDQAFEQAEMIWQLKDYYDGFRRRSFVYAMLTLFKKDDFDFAEFLQKVKNQPTALVDCATKDQYIALIEEIYNYRRRQKVNLRY